MYEEEYTQLVFGVTTTLPKQESVILGVDEKPLTTVIKQRPIGFIWNEADRRDY